MALDEPKDTDNVYDVNGFQFIVDKDFYEKAKPVLIYSGRQLIKRQRPYQALPFFILFHVHGSLYFKMRRKGKAILVTQR